MAKASYFDAHTHGHDEGTTASRDGAGGGGGGGVLQHVCVFEEAICLRDWQDGEVVTTHLECLL